MKPSPGFLITSELIAAVKRKAYIPNAQNTITDDDIISYINEEMQDSVVPLLKSSKEEYLTYQDSIPIQPNKSKYVIPYRAVGGILRDLKFRYTDGSLKEMTRIQPEDRHYFEGSGQNRFLTYYFEGDQIVLVPEVGVSGDGELVVLYYLRPNDIVKETRVGQISSINTTTGEIVIDNLPANIATNTLIDFLQWKPGHRIIKFDIPVIGINSITKTVTVDPADIPSELAVDDILASAGECITPQIPPELQSLLIERVVSRCHQAQNDDVAYSKSEAKILAMESRMANLIKNRDEGNPQKINNLNSPLRRASMSRRRFFR